MDQIAKPTLDDAVAYLRRVAPQFTWFHKDHMIWDQEGDNHPAVFAHEEDLHWCKRDKKGLPVVGARGTPLWIFPGR